MSTLRLLPALLLAVALGAGCSSPSGPIAGNEDDVNSAASYASEAGVRAEANALPADEFEIDTYADGEAAKTDMSDASFGAAIGVGGTVAAEIDPLFWFRVIREHERRYVVEFEQPDSLTKIAHVRIVDRLRGTFNVITEPDTVEGGIVRGEWIKKPLEDTSVRKATFVRRRCVEGSEDERRREDDEDGHRDGWSRWRLAAVSGADITSKDGTRQITSVRIRSGDVDVTVTDPLVLVRRGQLLRIAPLAAVHVTATTADPTDVVVLYSRWGRMRLHAMEDGTFQGRFVAPLAGGLRHFAVNALSRGTMFDDALPYDSKAWALPFVVAADRPEGDATASN